VSYSWTQPCCNGCYAVHEPGRKPTRLDRAETEKCAICGTETESGIYIRIDPKSVSYPSIER
jgi:hypothetical protein